MRPFVNISRLFLLAAAIATVAMTSPGFADEVGDAKKIDVAPQPLSGALRDFSEQSGLQVAYVATLAENVSSKGADDASTPAVALSEILDNTGLEYRFVNADTVAIGRLMAVNNKAEEPGNAKTGPRQRLMAQASGTKQVQPTSPAFRAKSLSESDERDFAVEEIIVTAQKRSERLQDVPISMSVFSGDELDTTTARDVTEMLTRVPGLALAPYASGGTSQLTVRGVSASTALNAGSSISAYYLDTVPFGFVKSAFLPDPAAYDLDRVEALRGPQGTLYGANALNGVVRILTKDANANAFDFKARASGSSTRNGSESYRGDMAINVPIVDGKLAVRAVAGYQNEGGWIDKPNHNEKDANDGEIRNWRLKVNAQPSENLSIGLSGWVSRADYDAPNYANVDGSRLVVLSEEPTSTGFDSYGLKVEYAFGSFNVVSSTGYIDFVNRSIYDTSGLGRVLRSDIEAKTFAEEIVFTSTGEGPWRWTAGGMYRDSEDRRFVSRSDIPSSHDLLSNLSESHAVFGEVTHAFIDGRLELTGGLRYFEDKVGLREHSRLSVVQPPQYVSRDETFSATTPRVVLTWHPSEQMTAYASYSEGFRSGVFQVPSVAEELSMASIEPDTLTNYEIGAKGSLLSERVNYDLALYHIDWKDVQRFFLIPVRGGDFSGLINGEGASGVGVDLGLTTQPVARLTLGVNASWNDLAMDRSEFLPSGVALFRAGERPDFSPEWTAGASVSYAFPLGRTGFEGRLSGSANYISELTFRQFTGSTVLVGSSDSLLTSRASLSIDAPRNWTAVLFVDNASNEQGVANPATGGRVTDPHRARIRPRTIGVQLEYRY